MPPRLRDDDYTVGWVCALSIELAAATRILDEKYEPFESDDGNILYTLGRIGRHNIVITCLPAGSPGTSEATAAAVRMQMRFKSITFGLLVGIGGGVLSSEADIRLGDIVISQPHMNHGGVVQYDIGKNTPSGFERTGYLRPPAPILLNALAKLRANHHLGQSDLSTHLRVFDALTIFSRSKCGFDNLFESTYSHVSGQTCEKCDKSRVVQRPSRSGAEVVVHYGTIASGNQVMKNGESRDELSSWLGGVMCFEMEAAGLMNIAFPFLVIRGICDYCDSHKSKDWQPYAAATAAACAKELLLMIQNNVINPSLATRVVEESTEQKMDEIGMLFYNQNNHSAAEEQLSSAGGGPERSLGREHQDTLSSIYMHGMSLYSQEKYSDAEKQFSRAAEGRERSLGREHQDTLSSIYWLSMSLYKQKKYSAAEKQFSRAAEGQERSLGREHQDTLSSIYWLGMSLYKQKKYSDAKKQFSRAAEGQKRSLGKEHQDTLSSIHWLRRSQDKRS